MAVVCCLSAYGVVSLTLQYYGIQRLHAANPERVVSFLEATEIFRTSARGATWSSFHHMPWKIAIAAMLSAGGVLVIVA